MIKWGWIFEKWFEKNERGKSKNRNKDKRGNNNTKQTRENQK